MGEAGRREGGQGGTGDMEAEVEKGEGEWGEGEWGEGGWAEGGGEGIMLPSSFSSSLLRL